MLDNPLNMFDVKGKVALITGAAGAFGMVAARVLAGAGCRLVLAAGKASDLATIATQCRDSGAEVIEANTRPGSEATCDALVARAVAAFGSLDILVVASGMNTVAKIEDMAPETVLSVMDANVTQSWLLARAATKQMKMQGTGGKIVFVSSARGLLGHPAGCTAYCASKAAVDGIRTSFDPAGGGARLIFGFEAVIIGGLGNIWGTLAGGVILGVSQAVGGQIHPSFQILAGHLVFLFILAVRPRGPFPKMEA